MQIRGYRVKERYIWDAPVQKAQTCGQGPWVYSGISTSHLRWFGISDWKQDVFTTVGQGFHKWAFIIVWVSWVWCMKTPTDTYCMYGELGLFGTLNSKQRRDQTPGQTGLLSVGKLNRCVFFHPQWYQHSGVGFMACEFWLLLTNHNAIHQTDS